MRTFLFSLQVLVFALASEAQQVRLDPTGDGESLLGSGFGIIAPNHPVIVGNASVAPLFIEAGWVAQMAGTDTVWSIRFPDNSSFRAFTLTSSGHLVVVGYITDLGNTEGLVVCINPNTAGIVWSKVLSSGQNEILERVTEKDGELSIIGTRASGSIRQVIEVRMLSFNGELLSARQQPAVTFSQQAEFVLRKGDNTLIFYTERTGASSTKNPALRILDGFGNEILHRAYGAFGIEDVLTDVAEDASGYMMTMSMPSLGAVGTIRLDYDFNVVLPGTQSLSAWGGMLSGGNIVADPNSNGCFFVSLTVDDVAGKFATVLRINYEPEWSTTFSIGFVDTRAAVDGTHLLMLAATVTPNGLSNSQTIATVDASGPSTTSCANLPAFTFFSDPYPMLGQVDNALGVWFDPNLVSIDGPDASNLTVLLDECLPVQLPIALVRFEARASGAQVLLEWVTATETNNHYFTIERSFDREVWEEVSRVPGAGNSLAELHYEAIDPKPFIGTSYYRLRQTDYDGASMLSSVVSVEMKASEQYAYPNPAMAGETIRFAGEFQVTDMLGRLITLAENVVTLPAGTYVFRSVEGSSVVQVAN